MDFMEMAISLARLAEGNVSPNPAVGAVLVKDGAVVGQGFTQPPGGHHAEVAAIEQAGENARGGTLYVTLEPCCHQGRTPPCTVAIIAARVRARASGHHRPPTHSFAGKGRAALEEAGIKTFVGEHEEQARQIIEAYAKFITTGLPFVTVKFAMSLDGKIATRSGDSKWISNAESRQFAHSLRHTSDAIMAGANTVLADDPHLTTRSAQGRGGTSKRQPVRIIVDGKGAHPTDGAHLPRGRQDHTGAGARADPERKRHAYQTGRRDYWNFPPPRASSTSRGCSKCWGNARSHPCWWRAAAS